MTYVISPDDLDVGDHVTLAHRHPDGPVKKAHVITYEGVVRKVSAGRTMVLLAPEDGSSGETWVYITNSPTYSIVIERHRRAWVEGGDYIVTIDGEPAGVTRIWRRTNLGWLSTSGHRSDRQAEQSGFVVGPRVLITVADR